MKRPIVIFGVGYVIGIIWGLYCKSSIALLYLCIVPIILIKRIIFKSKKRKFKLISFSRYSRYVKLFLKSNVIILILISSVISNTIVMYLNHKYEEFYLKVSENVELVATIVSNRQEKDYKYVYKIKLDLIIKDNKEVSCNDIYLYINTEKTKNYNFEYGDKIFIKGEYKKPDVQRNYKGFDYSKHLRQEKVYGTIIVDSSNLISENSYNKILEVSNTCFLKIKQNIENNYNDDTKDLLLGITLGYTENLDEQIKQDFKDSNISHILAVSGMHINFIILIMMFVLERIIGKRAANIILSIVLVIYTFITGFSPSIVRATIMGILLLFSRVFYKKNDIWTAISISLLVLLIYNPFLIESVGLQLSFLGTIGIILFNKTVTLLLIKIPKFIREILSVTISAQIAILPIMIMNFHTMGISFLITNTLVSIIIGPIVILGFFQIILFSVNNFFASLVQKILQPLLQILLLISKLGSKIPFNKIYVGTPSLIIVLLYYFVILVLNQIYKIHISKNKTATQIRVKNLINLSKYKFNQNRKRIVAIILIICLIYTAFRVAPKDLKIYFIDVGQGDSCLLETPLGKKILIDGGGNIFDKYYVGENTLLPYLLDRGVTSLDYVIISHFDSDHVRTGYFMLCKK